MNIYKNKLLINQLDSLKVMERYIFSQSCQTKIAILLLYFSHRCNISNNSIKYRFARLPIVQIVSRNFITFLTHITYIRAYIYYIVQHEKRQCDRETSIHTNIHIHTHTYRRNFARSCELYLLPYK